MTIDIFTDGACSGNQFENNTGGWGVVLRYKGLTKEIHGGEKNTTNNRMELLALISALKALKKKQQNIRVFSDSAYVTNGLRNKWYEKWLINGWKTADKKPVENKELWEELISLLSGHHVEFYLVKGHVSPSASERLLQSAFARFAKNNGGHFNIEEFVSILEGNNRADALANLGTLGAKA